MPRYQRILGKILATPFIGVIVWIVGSAIVWAVGGLIFGMCFGAISALVHAEPWRVVSVGAYFAFCGGAAGTVLGAIRATCDRHEAYGWSEDWETNAVQGERIAGPDLENRKTVVGPPAARRRFDAASPVLVSPLTIPAMNSVHVWRTIDASWDWSRSTQKGGHSDGCIRARKQGRGS
jgi:hypothetical protein